MRGRRLVTASYSIILFLNLESRDLLCSDRTLVGNLYGIAILVIVKAQAVRNEGEEVTAICLENNALSILADLSNFSGEDVQLCLRGIVGVFHDDLDCHRLVIEVAKVGNLCILVNSDAVLCNDVSVCLVHAVLLAVNLKCQGCVGCINNLSLYGRIGISVSLSCGLGNGNSECRNWIFLRTLREDNLYLIANCEREIFGDLSLGGIIILLCVIINVLDSQNVAIDLGDLTVDGILIDVLGFRFRGLSLRGGLYGSCRLRCILLLRSCGHTDRHNSNSYN